MLREPNEIQRELFDEFIDVNLKPKQKIHRRIIKKRLPPHFTFTLSYENVIVSIIVLILLTIVSFSLGIERGRRLVNSSMLLPPDTAAVEVKESNFKKIVSNPPFAPEVHPPLLKTEKEKKPLSYAVQVATFKQKTLAKKEISRLRKLKYDPFSFSYGKFHLVFVGNYPTKELARQDLKKLRKIYKDCFIKKITE